MKKLLFSVLFSVLFFLTSNSRVLATTYYVAGDTGSDSNTSVQAQSTSTPWQTIQKAANTVVAGDTVNVKGNITYTGTNFCGASLATVCLSSSGAVGNYITYQAWSGTGTPIVQGPSNAVGFDFLYSSGAVNFNKINGFIIKNTLYAIYLCGTNNIISNNIIYNTTPGAFDLGILGGNLAETDSAEIYNNVLFNMYFGIAIQRGVATIENNIITNGTSGLSSNSGAYVHLNIDYNDVYNNTNNYSDLGFLQRGGHDMSVDPGFVDSSSYNFNLLNTSPLIDAGVSLSGVPNDIVGTSRPQGLGYDIGAYETSYSNPNPINANGISYYTPPTNLMTLLATYMGEDVGDQFAMQNSFRGLLIGDVNSDGYADLLAGARHIAPIAGFYSFFGKPVPVNTAAINADVILRGTAANSRLGDGISLGDINGDGKNELLLGDYGIGSVYIYKTGSSFVSGTVTSADATITGPSTFGSGLTFLGDVNGDGYGDYIIDAGNETAKAYLFYGGPTLSNKTSAQANVVYDVSGGDVLFTNAGDLNNDGYDDIIISCPTCNSNHGAVYIFYGGKNLSNKTLSQSDVIITGATSENSFGEWMTLSDVNGDGISDLIVGSDGKTYVFFGGVGFSNKTSLQADVIFSKSAGEIGGLGTSVGSADINNDGYNDVITSNISLHRTYVFYGSPSITSEDTSKANLVFDYVEPEEGYFGTEITTGDVNGDGYTEIATGNGLYNQRQGKVWLFAPPHGSP